MPPLLTLLMLLPLLPPCRRYYAIDFRALRGRYAITPLRRITVRCA